MASPAGGGHARGAQRRSPAPSYAKRAGERETCAQRRPREPQDEGHVPTTAAGPAPTPPRSDRELNDDRPARKHTGLRKLAASREHTKKAVRRLSG
jgi:hypothetical protein